MEKFFKLKENNTNVKTEIFAGLTTFFTMAYIIFVNPSILSETGMPWGGVFVATIISSIIGTLVMGLFANVPYAQAPGMGLNAFFTYVVCFSLGFTWKEALALVLICGIINIIFTLTKFRKALISSIPDTLQNAISGGIGMFIAYIGIKNAGFLNFTSNPGSYTMLGNDPATATIISNSSIVPALVNFSEKSVLIALFCLVLTIILLVKKVKGALFIGIIATTILSLITGHVSLAGVNVFDISSLGEIKITAFAVFTKEGFPSLFSSPNKIFLSVVTILAFSLSDMFDTIGTFIGTGRVSGIFDAEDEKNLLEGGANSFNSKMDKALFADAIATSIGAIFGTSNVTTYVESAAGIGAGGRTGLTSVVVSILFLLCLPFAGIIGIVPAEATSAALIVVGIMMMASFKEIDWANFEEATPAFLTAIIMGFAYNISYGIAAGFIFHCIIKLVKGEIKEVHPILIGSSLLFILNFIILAFI